MSTDFASCEVLEVLKEDFVRPDGDARGITRTVRLLSLKLSGCTWERVECADDVDIPVGWCGVAVFTHTPLVFTFVSKAGRPYNRPGFSPLRIIKFKKDKKVEHVIDFGVFLSPSPGSSPASSPVGNNSNK